MTLLISAAGVFLLVAVLRDLFHTLFHPGGQGAISHMVLAGTWRLARWLGGRGRLGELAGPLGMVAVISTWVLGVVLGGALVYWPGIAENFSYGVGLREGQRSDFLDALYLSLTTTTTLGFGDIVPTRGWLRIVTPLQALIGFALLTAAVTWVLQVYPALTRRRTLAARLNSLQCCGFHDALRTADSAMPAMLLDGLAGHVIQVTVDLRQYAETYYFRDQDSAFAVSAVLPYAAQLAAIAQESNRSDLRLSADALGSALDSLSRLVAEQFLHISGTVDEILHAYAADHGHALPSGRLD